MNDRKTEAERITKEQLATIERCLKENKVNPCLKFNFDLTRATAEILKGGGYVYQERPGGFYLIIDSNCNEALQKMIDARAKGKY